MTALVITQGIIDAGRGLLAQAEGAGLVIQQSHQQARADAVHIGDISNDLSRRPVPAIGKLGIIFQPAATLLDKTWYIKTDLRRSVGEQAVGNNLVLRAPHRAVINWNLHRHAGREGGHDRRYFRIGPPNLFDRSIKVSRQPREGIPHLRLVIDQVTWLVGRPPRRRRHGGCWLD